MGKVQRVAGRFKGTRGLRLVGSFWDCGGLRLVGRFRSSGCWGMIWR